jgi:hypothetical protein
VIPAVLRARTLLLELSSYAFESDHPPSSSTRTLCNGSCFDHELWVFDEPHCSCDRPWAARNTTGYTPWPEETTELIDSHAGSSRGQF